MTVADTYASRAAKKAGRAKKGGNGAGATSHSARRESGKCTVPTSSQSSVGGIQMIWGILKSTTPGAIYSAL